jgi:hypothetical protein
MMKFRSAKLDWADTSAKTTVFVVSAIVAVVWVFTKPIVFTYDSVTYIEFARELQLGKSADANYLRLPIFPAILWAFHITDLKHTVFWLIVFQSCLAVGSCWLFYLTARLLEPRGAFFLSFIFIGSLLPFVQVKHIMTEQTFFFETVLTVYGTVAYLTARTNREALLSITIMSLGAALMMLTRPQGAYVAPVLFATVAALAWRRWWIVLIGVSLVIAAVWSAQAIDQRIRLGSQASAGNFDNSHTTGRMLLFTFYLDGHARGNIRISPENGPATAELKALLLEEFAKPDTFARRKGYLKTVAPKDVPAFVETIFNAPDSDLFTLVAFAALDERLGLRKADRLFLQVCLEAALTYPVETARLFLEKGLEVYFNPWMLPVPVHPQFPPGFFGSPLADDVAAAGDYTNPTTADRVIDRNIRWLMRGAILLAIVTLPMALRCWTWRVTITLLVFGLYLNFAVVLGNSPLFRYAIYAIPVNLICAYVGAIALISFLHDRSQKSSVVTNG